MKINNLFNKLVYYATNKEYISFDIFDTLIYRDFIDEEDKFNYVGSLYKKKYGIEINDLFYLRKKAEKNARNNSNNEEVSLREVYKFIQIDKVDNKKLYNLEVETELKHCVKNELIYKFYCWCIKKGKKVIITSDMYLEKKDIIAILEKNGYSNYKNLYLSSDIMKRKSSGTIFKYILSNEHISSSSILHIGDNKKSDFIIPKKMKIKSLLIPKKIKYIKLNSSTKKNNDTTNYMRLNNFINNHIDIYKDNYYRFGYEKFGCLLSGFCYWLNSELKSKNITAVYFLSRDGFIIKKAYDKLFENDDDIETFYLELSRRSTRVPMLWLNLSLDNIVNSFPAATLTNIDVFFDTIGLEKKDYTNILKENGIDENYSFKKDNMINDNKIITLYESIKEDIYNNSKKEYKYLVEYLKQMIHSDRIAIVDIGWRGSMQSFVQEIIKNENLKINIVGYYVGLTDGAKKYRNRIEEYGYLFDCLNQSDVDIRGEFVGLFESMFLRNIGSIKKYEDQKGKIVPVYYQNEYYNENGNLYKGISNILNIQDGAIDFVVDFKNNDFDYIKEISKKNLFIKFRKVGIKPSKKELNMFSNIEFFDGTLLKLANPKSLFYYIIHPKALIKDFYDSRWKVGFMKKLFKLNFPYEKIYKLLKRN